MYPLFFNLKWDALTVNVCFVVVVQCSPADRFQKPRTWIHRWDILHLKDHVAVGNKFVIGLKDHKQTWTEKLFSREDLFLEDFKR